MMNKIRTTYLLLLVPSCIVFSQQLKINTSGYYEAPGVNVMMFDDFYPDGHQGGFTIVQCGRRIAANGDLRLEPTPGQWSPVPKVGWRVVDTARGRISVSLSYPDSSKDRKGFNPIEYPDLNFSYTIRTAAVGNSIVLTVDLDKPLPERWAGKVGLNLEIFPGEYFGEHYLMDGVSGIFPRQADGPMVKDADGRLQVTPLAVGRSLVIAPARREKRITIVNEYGELQLLDERALHNNGWFVLRSTIPAGRTERAIEWIITPEAQPDWHYPPVIQVSQVGYHPLQTKFAVIELEKSVQHYAPVQLIKTGPNEEHVVKTDPAPSPWGQFLRYTYVRFDFSDVRDEGIYKVRYGSTESNEFEIRKDIYARHVWQPTLEYFLPVQMCHMRVNDRYKVWHGLCHMDDASMAPVNFNHFDGYYQHGSTLTRFKSGDHVPGLNAGGWHDAGDYDLRIESQAETVYRLSQAYELFADDYDETSINQQTHIVEIHRPDGRPDILQQVEHGLLTIIGGYESMGRLYRGIICPTLRQYVHLGDASTSSDNIVYTAGGKDPILQQPLPNDDGLVFTEENPGRELYVAQALAAAARVMKGYNPNLAEKCVTIAKELYQKNSSGRIRERLNAAAELYLTTSSHEYEKVLLENQNALAQHPEEFSDVLGRITAKLRHPKFTEAMEKAVRTTFEQIREQQKENPYGVPYKPYIWGAGWGIQGFGVKQLFLHIGFPKIFPVEYALNALNFVLGCHPGENTSSFASGVGAQSLTVAYGVNRDEWSYIPGGISSGTALIRPDLPELKVWPYFWQQTEYVMGGGATDFILLSMAADHLLNGK